MAGGRRDTSSLSRCNIIGGTVEAARAANAEAERIQELEQKLAKEAKEAEEAAAKLKEE